NSRLENLPPEIRNELLSTLEINELCSLVHASPVFYKSYRLYRDTIIRRSLARTLADIIPDAVAVSEADTDVSEDEFLSHYRSNRARGAAVILDKNISLDQLIGIAAFYRRTIQPLVAKYTHWVQETLPEARTPLSRSETIRVTRAMYRFQLYCWLWGQGPRRRRSTPRITPPDVVLYKFFCKYKPWEVEEILCIWSFASRVYNRLLSDLYSDLQSSDRHTSAESRPRRRVARYNLDDEFNRSLLLDGTLSVGLELLHTVLSQKNHHDDLVHTVRMNLQWPVNGSFHEPFFKEGPIRHRWMNYRTEEDQMQRRRDPLPFTGDGDASGPPLAWTMMWKGTYSNLYGCHISEELRQWGYIMWDAERLQKLYGDDVLLRQRES
ncbi:uncharacterized protein EI97DRAFT_347476, partial [Westerdykella ornata]